MKNAGPRKPGFRGVGVQPAEGLSPTILRAHAARPFSPLDCTALKPTAGCLFSTYKVIQQC